MRNLSWMMLVAIVFVFCGCTGNKSARIKGEFSGMKQKNVIIEEVVPGRTLFIDSVKTNSRGKFSVKYRFRDENPVFLKLRIDEDFLTLLVSPGESIKVSTVINLARNYDVEGSAGSQLVKDLNTTALDTYGEMEKFYLAYCSSTLNEEKRNYERQLSELYVTHKRRNIEFLLKNCKSLASVMALYQSLPSGIAVFGEKNDFRYFAMVADSLSTVYPNSPHVKSLLKNVENETNAIEKVQAIKFNETLPNIELPDIYGINHELSALVNSKTILLTFWSVSDPGSGLLNKELKELYGEMKERGFEIYQVSLDSDKNTWVGAIIEQNIPWVSVIDVAGGSRSIAARIYQITSVPANYLISSDGTIVAKNIWGPDLTKKVDEITR